MTNGVPVESYGYDALGRRAWVTAHGVTTHFVNDGPHIVAETDDTGVVLRRYEYGPGMDDILSMTVIDGQTETSYRYLKDHLNTVIALLDDQGSIVESYEYDAWGNVLAVRDSAGLPLTESAVGNRFLFQGREYSWSTGLYNFRARWYDPETGRWLSNDPIGISGGLNQYVFCANNPVNFRDPYGLCAEGGDPMFTLPNGQQIPYPPGVDINKNIEEAKRHLDPRWFYDQVKNKGPWDYKQQGRQYQDFGNFNYGATGKAFGFSENTLLREAGRAQQKAGTSKPEWGNPGSRWNPFGGSGTYGDDPADAVLIQQGVQYYQQYQRQQNVERLNQMGTQVYVMPLL